jgi:hypothetical protein
MKQDYLKELFASTTAQDLEPIVELLAANDIAYTVQTQGTEFNPNMVFSRSSDSVKVMVAKEDYEEAKALLIQNGLVAEVTEEDGYREMLGSLDIEDLEEMVFNYREYPPEQVAMAKQILAERGVTLAEEDIAKERQAIANEQRKPMTINTFAMIIWILFSATLIGIVFSIGVLTLKGKDINGKSYLLYSKSMRGMAKILLLLSIAITVFLLLIRFP